jgi:hypothetical protein
MLDSLFGHRPSEPAFDDRDRSRHGEPEEHRPPAEVVHDEHADTGDPEPETVKAADEPPQPECDEAPPQAVEDSEWTALVCDQRCYPPDGKSGEHEEERLGRLSFEHLSVRQHGSEAGGHGPVTVQPYGT